MKMKMMLGLLAFAVLASCSKDPVEENNNNNTKTATLDINVVYQDGSVCEGADVTIYSSQADYSNKTNGLKTLTSDATGLTSFKELEAKQYWWYVKKDKQTNASSSFWTGGNLVAGQTLSKTTQIR